MVDVWKVLRPRDAGYTYFHQGGSARIDRIYCSRSVCQDFSLIATETSYVTDLAALHAVCSILPVPDSSRPPQTSIWKARYGVFDRRLFPDDVSNVPEQSVSLLQRNDNVVKWLDSVLKPDVKR